MRLEQHRQRANTVEVRIEMAHVVAHRRATVQTLLDHVPALAQITLGHPAPAHILRIAHSGTVAHARRIIAKRIAVTKAQNVFHLELLTQ